MKQERSAADEREEKMNLCVYSFVCVCVCVCVASDGAGQLGRVTRAIAYI